VSRPRKYEPGWCGTARGGQFGTYTAESCPREGCTGKIISNGNYFCEFWTWYPDDKPVDYSAGECDWALPHPQTEYADKMISWRLSGYWEEGEVQDPNDRYNTLWIVHKTEPEKPAESETPK